MAIKSVIEGLTFTESEESAMGSNSKPKESEYVEEQAPAIPQPTNTDGKSDMQIMLERLSQTSNTINMEMQSPATSYPTTPMNQEEETVEEDYSDELFSKKYLNDVYSKEFRATHNIKPKIDDSWEFVDLPSRCIFYPVTQVKVRPLKVRHLCKIQGAVENKAISGILNVLDTCIDMNIRDLTQPDFRFLMYWWRLHSFPKTPLKVTWYSKYGNKNVSTVAETELAVTVSTETRERVKEWRDKGFTYPTVREMEYSVLNNLNSEDEWLFNYAQYYIGDSVDEKVQHLDDSSASFKEDVDEFKKVFEHGVEESIYSRDIYFDKQKYVKDLNEKIEYLKKRAHETDINSLSELDEQKSIELEAIYEAIGSLESELMNIEKLNGAEEEKIELPFRLVNLLPDVQLTADTE